MTTCRGYVASSGWPCAEDATTVALAGCRHEHVSERWFCDRHTHDARTGHMICGDCQDGAQPHRCPLRLVRTRAMA